MTAYRPGRSEAAGTQNANVGNGPQYNNNAGGVQKFQETINNFTSHEDRQSRDRCLDYFAVTDPRDVKTNIHQTRGQALKQSYEWILHHPQFQSWRDSSDSQVLWVKGDPGKGKTMLLCGIIDELGPTTKLKDSESTSLLSFFFCQATVPKLSNAHAVLRGLIYMLVDIEPSFLTLIQKKKFKEDGQSRFGDEEAWETLCNMLLATLSDKSVDKIYIVVDALDECVQDQEKLLRFILQDTKGLAHVKWIISSRNHITQRTILADSQAILSLELRENAESVSGAIAAYISSRIAELESLQGDQNLFKYVQQTLEEKAEGTFLWVALVVQELQLVDSWDVRQVVDDVPTGLDDLYARMMKQIARENPRTQVFCCNVLSAVALAYRPLQLLELGVVSGLPDEVARKTKNLETIISRSGSFLTVRDGTIYFVHQSAKDFLDTKGRSTLFPSGSAAAHKQMFIRSIKEISNTLRRDIYGLGALGTHINQLQPPSLDPLVAAQYSCIYWVNHLRESGSCEDIQDDGAVDRFLRTRYLYWLEALSLMRSMTDGIMSIQRLRDLLLKRAAASPLSLLVQDAYRFVLYHRNAIERYPLQAYGSGIVFSPSQSSIKELFWHERPKDTTMVTPMGKDWDAHTGACLQKLEGHNEKVTSVVLSADSRRVASRSDDKTIKIWDTQTGACLQTLEGHNKWGTSVVFFADSRRVASGSDDKTIKIWDAQTGACLQTLGIASAVKILSFDATGSSLHTYIGIIALRDSPTLAPPILPESLPSTPQSAQSAPATRQPQGHEFPVYGISSDGYWIMRHSQDWLWLPPTYRPSCHAVGQSGFLALGCQSGRVLIFRFLGDNRN
ncbi:hypothetical protein PENCOP_c005G02539 [Penicillium coprophilum]|uniref:NACHT domain-containing protein n=1 Tax=Penicillium coprophilum TaxID=36646 RepID=A0A1V6USJ0_9EURO|nr:hypothetical protein PENCOP_c005G02539 [Penicillium coprophilum]